MSKKNSSTNKVVVITGGTSGIGLACAYKYIEDGCTVITIARNQPEDKNLIFYYCDVAYEDQIKAVFAEIEKMYKKIDILINSAGYGLSGAVELLQPSDVSMLMQVNIVGTTTVCKYALPLMGKGSKIFNLASAMALFPLPFRATYAAAKAAVLTLSYGMRMELAPAGIDVCAICPGDVKTNFTKNRVKVFETNSRYGDRISKATLGIDAKEHKRMPVTKVSNAIYKQSKKRKTKHKVIIGAKYKLLYAALRIFPQGAVLRVTNRLYGGVGR